MSDSSNQYMEIFYRLPMAGLIVNVSGKPDFVANRKFLSMIGYTQEEFTEVMNNDYRKIFDETDILLLRESLRDAKNANISVSREMKLLNRSEQILYTIIEAETTEQNDGIYYLCSLLDVSELKKTQLALQNEQRRLNTVISCTNDVIYEYDIDKDTMRFYDSNNQHSEAGKYVEIAQYSKVVSEEQIVMNEDIVKMIPMFMGNDYKRIEIRSHKPHDKRHYYWHEMMGTLLKDDSGKAYMSIGILRDIDENKKKTLGFKQMAERDSLTQLFNHNSVKAQVDAYFEEGGRDKINALILIDLDDFKSVNDTYGHRFGDEVIKATAEMLNKTFGVNDILGRIGGDEYLVFCKDMLEMTAIQEKLDHLFSIFSSTEIGKEGFHVRASIGVAISPNDGTTYKRLFDKADKSMYKVKRSGKNTYDFCS